MACRRSVNRAEDNSPEISNDPDLQTIYFPHKKTPLTKYHVLAFFLTFVSYALFHATRKTFSNVKVTISETWTPQDLQLPNIYDDNWNGHHMFSKVGNTSVFLGLLDTVFMISYAIGLFISGAVGDRLNLKYVLSFGMCSSSLTVFLFGVVSEWCHIYSVYWYVIFWSLSGLLQSTGWPTVVAIIGNWFGKSSRGFIMGVWGASPCVGNILGTVIVNGVLHYGYQYSFLVTSCVTFGFGIIILFGLISSPRDVGLPGPDDCSKSPRTSLSPDQQPLLTPDISEKPESFVLTRPKAVGLCQACCLPGVLGYSLAYACLKFVNYSFFFWLPFYLQKTYKWKEDNADLLSIWYDVGGIIGGVFVGFISDKLQSRSPVCGLMLALSPITLYFYSVAPGDLTENASIMTMTGIVIGGVSSLISTAVSADLGRHPDLANSKEALSTVTGIIDGTGSFGAAFGQMLVPVIQTRFGWKAVFYLFIIMTIFSLFCILNIVIRDTIELIQRFLRRRNTFRIDGLTINSESSLLND